MKNKSLSSRDIKSLYTNISVSKCTKRLGNHRKINATLLLTVNKIVKICTLCIKHCFFFNVMVFSICKKIV